VGVERLEEPGFFSLIFFTLGRARQRDKVRLMSLKKKIVLSFFLSAFLIAILAVLEYVNFVAIRNEIRFLEITDTIRSKSLQLRRHEKNFFLYGPRSAAEESKAIHQYLDELGAIFSDTLPGAKNGVILSLRENIRDYRRGFDSIDVLLTDLSGQLRATRASAGAASRFFPLLEAAIYERPHQAAEFLRSVYRMPGGHPIVAGLDELDAKISALRKNGEDIIANAKELDRSAREKVDRGIRISQAAILIIFPAFLATGVTLLFLTTRNVVSRLRLLMDVMEKSGQGTFAHVKAPVKAWGNDEVGLLIRKFDDMEDELEVRQAEIDRKNRELLQSKKLAAIGTLAAGVAHELNNPLNNIYLSTQVLAREAGDACPPPVKEVMADILGQTARVKKIVADLLEFARGREPQFREVELLGLIRGVLKPLRTSVEQEVFSLESDEERVVLQADPDQLEQVFTNLFTNALEAMSGRGEVRTIVMSSETHVQVRVADTGRGMPKEALEKIYDPFFSLKEKGTGLGLAIVFNIIKKHSGDITVESEEGKGTTFTITLPRK
jgi:signal transduction histidine kinase